METFYYEKSITIDTLRNVYSLVIAKLVVEVLLLLALGRILSFSRYSLLDKLGYKISD